MSEIDAAPGTPAPDDASANTEEAAAAEPVPPSEEFLLHALQASGEEAALVRVAACDVQAAAGPGDNFLGELWRARVTLEDAAGAKRTRALVVKRVPHDRRADYLKEARLFDVESAAYLQALPALLQLLRKAYGEAFRPFWPHFVYASLDRTELVMEDLSALEYVMADRRMGLDLDQSKATIKCMALLHASSVGLYMNNQPAVFPFVESLFRDSTRAYIETYLRCSVRQLALQVREWPDYGEAYANKLLALEDKVWELVTTAAARDDTGLNVLNHGDLWVNNLLFRRGEGPASIDLDVALIDWQNTVWTSPAVDLLYFLYTSPSEEVRREHGDALLQLYHGTLQQALQAMGAGARAPSLEALRADLRRRFAFALYPAVAELPNILAPPDVHYDITLYFQEEPPRNHAYAQEPYASIIRRLLPLFQDCGVF